MGENILSYARPGTVRPPLALPAVFPGNQRPVAIFSIATGMIWGIIFLTLHPVLGMVLLVSSVLSVLPLVLFPRRDYLVLDAETLHLNGVSFRRSDVLACVRGWNGFTLRLCDGRSTVNVSMLEIRRKDVARLEDALREYFGSHFHAAI